jgi:hypothetical protein
MNGMVFKGLHYCVSLLHIFCYWWDGGGRVPKIQELLMINFIHDILMLLVWQPSFVRSTCILWDTTLPKRYLVLPIAFDMKHWEGQIWFNVTTIRRTFLMNKFSFDLLNANYAYENFRLSSWHNFCSMFLAFWTNFRSKPLTLFLSMNLLRTSCLSSSLQLFLELCNTLFRLLTSLCTTF